jgi:hypothetical protein
MIAPIRTVSILKAVIYLLKLSNVALGWSPDDHPEQLYSNVKPIKKVINYKAHLTVLSSLYPFPIFN